MLNKPDYPQRSDDMGAAPNTFAKAFNTAEGATSELIATLERARDERFRLIRLIKEVETRLASTPPPAPTDKIERLTDRVHNLDDAINQRFNKLSDVELRIDKRLDQLSRLEQAIRDLTTRFGEQVKHARSFEQAAAEARRQMQLTGDVIVDDSRARLEQFAAAAEQQAQRSLEQRIDQLTAEQVDSQLARINDQLDERLTDLESQMDGQVSQASAAALQRFEAERTAIATQLDQQHRIMMDQLASDLAQQHSDALSKITSHVDKIEEAFGQEVGALVDSANTQVQQAADRFNNSIESQIASARRIAEQNAAEMTSTLANQVDAQIAEARRRADGTVIDLEESLRGRIDDARTATDAVVDMLEKQYADRLNALPARALETIEQAERDLNDRLGKLREHAEAAVARSEQQLEQRLAALPTRAHAATRDVESIVRRQVDDARASAEQTLAPLRKQIVEALQKIHTQASHARRSDTAAEPAVVTGNVLDLIRRLSEPVGEAPDAPREAA